MKKKYEQPEESKIGPSQNPENNTVNEPAMEYGYQAESEMIYSPPLTEEELADCITGDELREYMHQYIHELFANK